jgi:hypothetical protein
LDQAGTPTEARPARGAASTLGLVLASGAAIAVTLAATVAVGAAPRDPARVAAVFPPWWTSAQAASAAASAGDIAGAGGVPFILILRGESGQLSTRARAAGAWLLLDPDAAGVCANPLPEPR